MCVCVVRFLDIRRPIGVNLQEDDSEIPFLTGFQQINLMQNDFLAKWNDISPTISIFLSRGPISIFLSEPFEVRSCEVSIIWLEMMKSILQPAFFRCIFSCSIVPPSSRNPRGCNVVIDLIINVNIYIFSSRSRTNLPPSGFCTTWPSC